MPYQRLHSAASLMRKSADKSITFTPRANNCSAINIAVPLGVAKNTTSHWASVSNSGAVNSTLICPRKLGYTASTRTPVSAREVTTATSTSECKAKIRNSSTPV